MTASLTFSMAVESLQKPLEDSSDHNNHNNHNDHDNPQIVKGGSNNVSS